LLVGPDSIDSQDWELARAVTNRAPVGFAVAGDAFAALATRAASLLLDGDADVEEFADAATLVRGIVASLPRVEVAT
jgi:hypothetical protein